MLRLVLPKGSLERATVELFEAADLPVFKILHSELLLELAGLKMPPAWRLA